MTLTEILNDRCTPMAIREVAAYLLRIDPCDAAAYADALARATADECRWLEVAERSMVAQGGAR